MVETVKILARGKWYSREPKDMLSRSKERLPSKVVPARRGLEKRVFCGILHQMGRCRGTCPGIFR